ncbi:MAG: hypothetical protein IJ713_09405, partial [Oscillibacter sp.]|nr:hypothetical protein [Oscillibacter sp.]
HAADRRNIAIIPTAPSFVNRFFHLFPAQASPLFRLSDDFRGLHPARPPNSFLKIPDSSPLVKGKFSFFCKNFCRSPRGHSMLWSRPPKAQVEVQIFPFSSLQVP